MSHNVSKPSASAPVAEGVEIEQVIRALSAAAGPGVIQSAMVAAGLFDPQLSGVVLDPSEPGGGYLAEMELAQGVTYLVLGVGKGVGNTEAGIRVVQLNEGVAD
jgi:hypothetical protein